MEKESLKDVVQEKAVPKYFRKALVLKSNF